MRKRVACASPARFVASFLKKSVLPSSRSTRRSYEEDSLDADDLSPRRLHQPRNALPSPCCPSKESRSKTTTNVQRSGRQVASRQVKQQGEVVPVTTRLVLL